MHIDDWPEESLSPQLDARIDAEWAAAARRVIRTSLPRRRRTKAGRIAWRIWKNGWSFSQHKSPYLDWWASLTAAEQNQVSEKAARYSSLSETLEAPLTSYQEIASCDDEERLWRKFNKANQLDLEEFRRLRRSSVQVRSAFAREFRRAVTRTLKDVLGVPAHRPKTRFTKADQEVDFWRRRILVYLLNTR
jgi:hypothetical protein